MITTVNQVPSAWFDNKLVRQTFIKTLIHGNNFKFQAEPICVVILALFLRYANSFKLVRSTCQH